MAAEKPGQHSQERRRSQRVFLSIPVTVEGKTLQGEKFVEETATLAVNAHGGLVTIAHVLDAREPLTLIHRGTGKQQACRVVYSGTIQRGKIEVGLEFSSPSPKFWQIDFRRATGIRRKSNESVFSSRSSSSSFQPALIRS